MKITPTQIYIQPVNNICNAISPANITSASNSERRKRNNSSMTTQLILQTLEKQLRYKLGNIKQYSTMKESRGLLTFVS